MSRSVSRIAICVSVSALLVGCGDGTLLRRTPRMGTASAIATSADVRVITTTPVRLEHGDYVVPRQVTCAEPSPDVAKIVSTAFGSSGALGVRGRGRNFPASGDLNTTLALSRSYAEGVAQMTERLATIQLLRDGLYRACEAYANGAITATTYSAMVSRFDKTMITMLMGELAAGNFGRSLAALAGSSSSKSSAELAFEEVTKREHDAKENLDRKQEEKRSVERTIASTPATAENAGTLNDLHKQSSEFSSQITQAREDHRKAEEQLKQTLKAMAESSAQTTATAAGGIARSAPEAAAAIAADLVQIQANYLNDHNIDAVKIACLNSFGRERVVRDVEPDHTKDGALFYRHRYERALSVWCDELVQSLKRNAKETAKASQAARAKAGAPAAQDALVEADTKRVDPAMKALFMADPQAVGPFDVEWEKVVRGAQVPPKAK